MEREHSGSHAIILCMALTPPIERRYTPPAVEEQERLAADARTRREAFDAEQEAHKPAKRAALAAGPLLRDLDAAVECSCSCHPTPPSADSHEGGVTCPCQLSREERAARRRALFEELDDWEAEREWEQRVSAELQSEAAVLGVSAQIVVPAAPMVITGVCDGRAFYLRERHGSWGVTIATDDDPTVDPWASSLEAPSIDIASGDDSEFNDENGRFSRALALRVAVTAVRSALLRNACEHEAPESTAHRFCRLCGVPVGEAEVWRWSKR